MKSACIFLTKDFPNLKIAINLIISTPIFDIFLNNQIIVPKIKTIILTLR